MAIATRALFTGAIGDASPRGAPFALTSAPAGGWTWFTDPRAVYRNGYLYFGYLRGSDGSVVLAAWDRNDGAIASTTVLHSALEIDDHDNPSILIRSSDSRLVAFYSAHLDSAVRYRVSTNPVTSDPTLSGGFAAEQTVSNLVAGDYTYTMPVELSGESGNPLRLFYRTHVSSDPELHYSRSDDDGATWASGVRLHDLTYTKIAQTATEIHFLASDHPADGALKVWHFYLDTSGTPAWRKSDGTALVSPSFPLQTTDMTEVYDGGATPVWVHDLAMDGNTPVGVFATFPDEDTDHRYRYARWDGDSWVTTQIAAAGGYVVTDLTDDPNQDFYSGGVVLDQSDPSIVYASREVDSGFELFRYVTEDDGATWSWTQLSDDGAKYLRPVSVRNAQGIRYLALRGTYADYLDYSVATVAGT